MTEKKINELMEMERKQMDEIREVARALRYLSEKVDRLVDEMENQRKYVIKKLFDVVKILIALIAGLIGIKLFT